MPLNLPYSISGRILDSSSNALANARVYLRNETSNKQIFTETDSDGQYLADAANISGGYVVGDTITVFVVYQNQSGSGTHVIQSAGGGGEVNITLSSISVGALRYFTVQEFYDYTGTSSDGDVVNPQKVVTVGVNVENEIDNLTGRKFDSNSGSYYTNPNNDVVDSYEYHDMRKPSQRDFFLRYTPINELLYFEVNTSSDDVSPSWTDLTTLQLDSFDDSSLWTGASGGSDTITLSNNYDPDNLVEGKAATYIAKSGTNNAAVSVSQTFSTTKDFTNKQLRIKVYIDSTSDFPAAGSTSVELRYGNDSSNYYSKTYEVGSLDAGGYTTLTIGLGESGISVTGSPDRTTCDYFAIVFTLAAASTTLTAGDIRLDDLRLGEEDKLDIDKETGRITVINSADYPSLGKNQVRIKYNYGMSSVPNDIKTLAVLMTARQLVYGTILKAMIGGRGENNLQNTSQGIRPIDMEIKTLLKRYRNNNILNT